MFIAETDAPAGAGSDFGIYRASADSGVQALLRASSPTPGFPDGGLIGNSTALISHPVGGIAFRSHSARSEPTIYHVPDPATPIPQPVISLQDAAPGTGGTFWFIANYALNARGDVFFSAKDTGTGPSFFSTNGIWRWNGESLIRLIRGGETAPSPGPRLEFENLLPSNSLYGRVCDTHGRIAVLAQAGDGTQPVDGRLGIWFGDEHSLRFICLEGERAPGRGAIWRRPTGTDGESGWPRRIPMQYGNARDRRRTLTPRRDLATDIDGRLFKVVEKGDYMMLRGKLRRVEELRLNHGSSRNDFREHAINAHGQIVYSIRAEDEFSFLIRAQIPFPEEATELSVVGEAGTIRLEMPSRVCHSYQLETARGLAGSWEERADPVVGDGNPLRFEIPANPADDARFFRVRISPIEYLPNIQ